MIKRIAASCILVIFVALISGCETVARGIGYGVTAAAYGAAEGAKNDWTTLNNMDAWIRKNLW